MTTIVIKYSEIPVFLHDGSFYRNLSVDNPTVSTFCIPADCFAGAEHEDPNINDVCQLLRVTMFWMLDAIPQSVLQFCHQHAPSDWQDAIAALPNAVESRILPDLLTTYTNKTSAIPFVAVIKTGRWELIEHTIRRLKRSCRLTAAAAEAGDVRVLRYLIEKGLDWNPETCTTASKHGNLECLVFARENGCPWGEAVSAGEGRCAKGVCSNAAKYGHLDCLQYAHQQGAAWNAMTLCEAACSSNLDCLRYVLENGCPRDHRATFGAAQLGNIASLVMLKDHGIPWDINTSAKAALCAEPGCLQFLHENGCPWDAHVPKIAARAGHVNTLMYAMEQGCPHRYVVLFAIQGSNLRCIKYLVEEKQLPLPRNAFIAALLTGKLLNLQYLLDRGCPFLDANFTHEDFDKYDKFFAPNNPEFRECVMFALERGWVPNQHFTDYIVARDQVNCASLLSVLQLASEEALLLFELADVPAAVTSVENVVVVAPINSTAPDNLRQGHVLENHRVRGVCYHKICQICLCTCVPIAVVCLLLFVIM